MSIARRMIDRDDEFSSVERNRLDTARNAFEIRHENDVNPDENRGETCSRVLGRTGIEARMTKGW
ncbi:MAG: hypothetical protein M0Z80_07385 [Treponema sp.]|nr:hypothetical protein [Treponema sp.]